MSLYKYDTHVHTCETSACGTIDGAMLVRMYKFEDYHGLVITDHYTCDYFRYLDAKCWEDKIDLFLQDYRAAYNEGKNIGLNVILGMEIQFLENYNDYLVYGITEEFLYNNKELYKHTLKSFWEFTRDKSILVYQAHPYRSWVNPANPAYIDGVEVYNGSPRYNSKNHRAYSFAKTNNLRMLSGSDFHERGDLATGGILTYETPADSREFYKLLNEDRIVELLTGE